MYWERIQAHNAVVTCALFHPKPQLILEQIFSTSNNSINKKENDKTNPKTYIGVHVFASVAGCDGMIKIFVNKLNTN